jgi:hypothetical protein
LKRSRDAVRDGGNDGDQIAFATRSRAGSDGRPTATLYFLPARGTRTVGGGGGGGGFCGVVGGVCVFFFFFLMVRTRGSVPA